MSRRSRTPQIADRLHSTAIHLLRLVRHVDEETELGPAQLSALSVLVFGGARTLGGLAAAEQVRPPSMTRVVSELEQAGLVRRRAHETDARAIMIAATANGVRLMQAGRARRTRLIAAWLNRLACLDADAIEAALPALEKLVSLGRQASSQRTPG
jgi:DNA-binding MarR family transcriptional regulator